MDEYRVISELLHEASLTKLALDAGHATLRIAFRALRRHPSGDPIEVDVELVLRGLRAIAVARDSGSPELRPSRFQSQGALGIAELGSWPFEPQEASLTINRASHESDWLSAARVDWLAGGTRSFAASALRLAVEVDSWFGFGPPAIEVAFLISGDWLTIESAGVPLDLDDWESQYRAWWTGWRSHWDQKSARQGDRSSVQEDTFIPAASDPPPDLSYRPPAEPPFLLEKHAVPPDVMSPVAGWFEGVHARDWPRVARSLVFWGDTDETREAAVRRSYTSFHFGRWGFARAVDDWWIEGNRACVIIRGIEHRHGAGPHHRRGENRESVWTFSLGRIGGRWCIRTFTQGWPAFGSAPKKPGSAKPWLAGWKSGSISGK